MFDFMFGLTPVIVISGMIIIFSIIIVNAVKGVKQWNKNNHSPVLTVEAKVAAKRADTSMHTHHDHNNTGMSHTTTSTDYYVSFEVESGDRLEFLVPDREYGMLVEGDKGRLTFQGTRYKSFERQIY